MIVSRQDSNKIQKKNNTQEHQSTDAAAAAASPRVNSRVIKTRRPATTSIPSTTHNPPPQLGAASASAAVPLPLPLLLLLLIMCLLHATLPAQADWLMDCGNCHCKWNSGKKTADCKNLSLSTVPENLSSEVQVLDLSHNRIPYLEQNAFLNAHLQNLHKLFIRNSTLQQVNPRSFTQLEILIELDLSNNVIRSLQPNVFARLIKVRALVLNGNLLESLGAGVFHNLKFLHKIELKHNRLMRIDAQAFLGVPLLSQIYLDGNQLSFLRKDSFESLKRLTALSLDQNPWNCTCELQLFRDFVLKQNLYTPPTACYYPLHLRSMLWIDDQPEAFACKPKIIFPARGASINTSKENVTLVCRVHASANTVIAWDYNKQLFRANAASAAPASLASAHAENQRVHIQLLRDEQAKEQEFGRNIFISRLTILGADKSDEGIYTCLAENAGGKDAVQMSLLVQKSSPRDLLMHSNLFIVICLMAVGLLSVSVLLSTITCCIYKRFKHLNPTHHEHLRHLNLSPQQLAGENDRNAINVVITGGTEVMLDSVSAVSGENTSLSNYKHHKAAAAQSPANPAGGSNMANSKYVDIIKCGMSAHNNTTQGHDYLDNQTNRGIISATTHSHSTHQQRHHRLPDGHEQRSATNFGENHYIELKSEDKLNLKSTPAELSPANSTRSTNANHDGCKSLDSHSPNRYSETVGVSCAGDYQPDLLPSYRNGNGNGNRRGSQKPEHSPAAVVDEATRQQQQQQQQPQLQVSRSSRSKYNINVQEYLQSKYGSGKLNAHNNNNNKQHAINGNDEQRNPAATTTSTSTCTLMHSNKREAPSIPNLTSSSLQLVGGNMQERSLQRHSKSLALHATQLGQVTRSQPTDSYEYRQPPPPPYSACSRTLGASSLAALAEQRRNVNHVEADASSGAGATLQTIVTASPSLNILTTTGGGVPRRQLL